MAQTAQKNAEQLAKVFGENSEEAKAALEEVQKHMEMANDVQHAANSYVNWLKTYAPDAFQNVSAVDKYKAGLINNLPAYASGGIVTSPTLALVGEAGPEAIVPLSGSSRGNLQQTIHDATYQATYQALIDVMKVKSVSSNDNKEIAIRIDTASSNMLARILLPAIIREGQRQGLNLVLQGVTN
jgi:SLT domain-containing protein